MDAHAGAHMAAKRRPEELYKYEFDPNGGSYFSNQRTNLNVSSSVSDVQQNQHDGTLHRMDSYLSAHSSPVVQSYGVNSSRTALLQQPNGTTSGTSTTDEESDGPNSSPKPLINGELEWLASLPLADHFNSDVVAGNQFPLMSTNQDESVAAARPRPQKTSRGDSKIVKKKKKKKVSSTKAGTATKLIKLSSKERGGRAASKPVRVTKKERRGRGASKSSKPIRLSPVRSGRGISKPIRLSKDRKLEIFTQLEQDLNKENEAMRQYLLGLGVPSPPNSLSLTIKSESDSKRRRVRHRRAVEASLPTDLKMLVSHYHAPVTVLLVDARSHLIRSSSRPLHAGDTFGGNTDAVSLWDVLRFPPSELQALNTIRAGIAEGVSVMVNVKCYRGGGVGGGDANSALVLRDVLVTPMVPDVGGAVGVNVFTCVVRNTTIAAM